MNNKFFKYLALFIITSFLVVVCLLIEYIYSQHKNYNDISFCSYSNEEFFPYDKENNCYKKMYELLIPKLLVYKVKKNNKYPHFITLKPSYVVPYEFLRDTDALIGYGVYDDMDAEEAFSKIINKPSYAFDCGIEYFYTNNYLCHFESSCISTDKFILYEFGQESSGAIHTFGDKIKQLNLQDKRIAVKMDIWEAEYEAIPEIIKYKNNVELITICLTLLKTKQIYNSLKLLDLLKKDYILIARAEHAYRAIDVERKCKYIKNNTSETIVLTYINKDLVDKSYLPWNQSSTTTYKINGSYEFPATKISWVVVLHQKLIDSFIFIKDFFKHE